MKEAEAVLKGKGVDYQMLYFTCSSLSKDDRILYGMVDEGDGNPNIFSYDLESGDFKILSDNEEGILRSYVYFSGRWQRGLGKASVSLDSKNNTIYYIQGNEIRRIRKGKIKRLDFIAPDRVTAFTHVSSDGKILAVPTTDKRALEYDLEKEGMDADRKPCFSIDERCRSEHLSSYISFYDTQSGSMIKEVRVPDCWITHVVFSPVDSTYMLFNNEWTTENPGLRRIWLYDGEAYRALREEGEGRSRNDWVCHEVWTHDGGFVVYHGTRKDGPFVGRINPFSGECIEIPLDPSFSSYGHFTVDGNGDLICDGYYHGKGEDDGGKGRYISLVHPDWEGRRLLWSPLAYHGSDWSSQDAHPHPVADHGGRYVYFTSMVDGNLGIYRVSYRLHFCCQHYQS